MDEAGDDEPARAVGGADRLGRLQRVLDLREVDVRVAVVDQRVQELERLEHGHPSAVQRQIVPLLPEDEVQRLVRVVLEVNPARLIAHGRASHQVIDTPTVREGDNVFVRLRRRKVVQWGLAYLAGAWLLLQVVAFLADAFDWPDQSKRIATLVLLIGLPITFVLAWYHGERGQRQVRTDPLLANLRSHPRYVGLLGQLTLPEN